jgi:hypothetical protein
LGSVTNAEDQNKAGYAGTERTPEDLRFIEGIAARFYSWVSVIGWLERHLGSYRAPNSQEHDMRKFHSIAALCGDGLRPELQALFDRLVIDPHSELFVRSDGMMQSGPNPVPKKADVAPLPPNFSIEYFMFPQRSKR